MQTRELPSSDWEQFLDQFSRDHHGWLTTVEHECQDAAPDVLRRPLVAVAAERATSRGVTVVVTLHPKDDPRNTIRVEDVASVRVDETDEGRPQNIEVAGDTGEHLRLRLRGVLSSDILLDGVAPGELS